VLYSGVLPFDWGRVQLADKSLEIIDIVGGASAGRMRFSDHFNWGYGTFFRKNNAKAGDVLRGVVDLEEDRCYLELGGDELLSEPFDW
jgi:hypothetical protein